MDDSTKRGARGTISPLVRVLEDEDEVVVRLEMPGVARDGLEIKVDGPTLAIEGRRSDEVPGGKFLLRERRREDYRKTFSIDESIDRDGISADLADGILTLRLKVKEAAKPRRIAVG